jgi:hypothetical protein
VLLATSSEAGLTKSISNGEAALLVIIVFRNVIVLALKRLASCILALALDDADAGRALDDIAEIIPGNVSLLLGREMSHDGGKRCWRQTRESELVDDMVGNGRVGLERHLGLGSRSRRRDTRGWRERRLCPGVLLSWRLGSSRDLTRSKKIRSDIAVKSSSLGALEELGRLCSYRSQPARNISAKGTEGVDDGVVLLIRVVLFNFVTDFAAEAGSHVGAHADIDAGGIELVRQSMFSIIFVDFNVTLSGKQGLKTARAG